VIESSAGSAPFGRRALEEVSSHPQFAHVHYLNLRKTLPNDATYKSYWANELHPSGRGFDLVTKKFADQINAI